MTEPVAAPRLIDTVRLQAPHLSAEVERNVRITQGGGSTESSADRGRIRELALYAIEGALIAADPRHVAEEYAPPVHADHADLPDRVSREVYRESVALTWRALISHADEDDQSWLLGAAAAVFRLGERLQEAVNQAPLRVLSQLHKAQSAMIRALVRGVPATEAAELYQIRLAPSYVVVLLDHASQTSRSATHDTEVLWTEDEVTDATLVLLPSQHPVPPAHLDAFCRTHLDCDPNGSVRAVMASAPSADAITTALDDARTVYKVTSSLDLPPGFYQLADVPLEAALQRCPDLAMLLAGRLAPLQSGGALLLRTLQVYQDTDRDRRESAKLLHIHPNTLDYRFRRIRQLTGLSPVVARDIQTLGTAVTAWRLVHGDFAPDF